MYGAMTQPSNDAGGACARFAGWLAVLALAILLLPGVPFAQPGGAPKGNPRLASLGIEIWPEYDRPAALVILRGAVAEGVKLPAAVSLRLPKTSGGAAAVAYSKTADGNLLNLKYESAATGEYITLKFEVPERFFHVEFYEPIATITPARNYRYAWPGDLAIDRVAVVVQEPAAASDITVEPTLDGLSTGQNGLRYRTAELGALEAGKSLPIAVRYTKLDVRPSAEILKPKVADLPVLPAAPPGANPHGTPAAAAGSGWPEWVFPLAGLMLLGLAGGAFVLWRWRRTSPVATPEGRACAKCGAMQAPGNRFCGSCGANLAG